MITTTPEKLRLQAEALLRAADLAESHSTDTMKKALAPALLEVRQARHSVCSSMDGMLDAVARLEKATSNFETVLLEVMP